MVGVCSEDAVLVAFKVAALARWFEECALSFTAPSAKLERLWIARVSEERMTIVGGGEVSGGMGRHGERLWV